LEELILLLNNQKEIIPEAKLDFKKYQEDFVENKFDFKYIL
jgi:hypothetical protein